jgi:hypothetical protein
MIPVNSLLLIGNEKKYLDECVDTGWISSEGPFVEKLYQKGFYITSGLALKNEETIKVSEVLHKVLT